MAVMHGRLGEMPLRGQYLTLTITLLVALLFGGWWVARGGRPDSRSSDLALSVMAFLACQWVAMGMMLRPGGRGLRMHAWRRVAAFGFAGCHALFAVLNACFPVLYAKPGQRLYGTGRWGYCTLLLAVGVVLGISAWRAGRVEPTAT